VNPAHKKQLPETETFDMVNVPEPAPEPNITFEESVFATIDGQLFVSTINPLPAESTV
jgi:hypothetical protein